MIVLIIQTFNRRLIIPLNIWLEQKTRERKAIHPIRELEIMIIMLYPVLSEYR